MSEYGGFDLAIAVMFFTIQIYCDFSGYSDIAIGCSKLMGINLMTNFSSPYFSSSLKEFWNKWHISLSTWFRDYIYFPLGGSRCSKGRHYMNLLLTFLISGLWHGADWTFVFWGGIHGVAQIIENVMEKPLKLFRNSKIGKIISVLFVFGFCNIAWVFFRADSLADALYLIKHLLPGLQNEKNIFSNTLGLNFATSIPILRSLSILALYDFFSIKRDVIEWISRKKVMVRWFIYVVFVLDIAFEAHIGESSFIYFQF